MQGRIFGRVPAGNAFAGACTSHRVSPIPLLAQENAEEREHVPRSQVRASRVSGVRDPLFQAKQAMDGGYLCVACVVNNHVMRCSVPDTAGRDQGPAGDYHAASGRGGHRHEQRRGAQTGRQCKPRGAEP
jgi:hypothetical protein